MLIVSDIFDQIKKVIGTCTDAQVYSRINESIEELANLGNWDPMVMFMDICTQGCEITLPDDVEVPLAINVGGSPANFRNKWFEFHLNGPGSECCAGTCTYSWMDKGSFPTFRDPIQPSQIAAYPELDEGSGKSIRVYGYDQNDKWIMEADEFGVLQDGFLVPVLFGIGSGIPSSQKVKRITRVSKPVTNGFVRLVAIDPGECSGETLLGLFRPNFTEPSFRRIKISGGGVQIITSSTCSCTTWVRMRVRRKVFKVSQPSDMIPLHSVTALKMMAKAIVKYEDDLLDEYVKYFNAARECLQREQKSISGPNQIKIQFQHSFAGKPFENMV